MDACLEFRLSVSSCPPSELNPRTYLGSMLAAPHTPGFFSGTKMGFGGGHGRGRGKGEGQWSAQATFEALILVV